MTNANNPNEPIRNLGKKLPTAAKHWKTWASQITIGVSLPPDWLKT